MKNKQSRRRVGRAALVAFLCAVLPLVGACGAGGTSEQGRADGAGPADNTASAPAGGATADAAAATSDPSRLDAEIERLERLAERSPADEETREALSRAYVRRADAHRNAGRPRDALRDYQNALRLDPDNEEAQRNSAEISPLVEGTPTGEYGEPAPLPITPNVTTEGDEQPPPAKGSSPAKTPAKSKKP